MKKFISLIFLLIGLTANASTTVPVVWPFSIGSMQANYLRIIIAEANKVQDKYNFVLENKPGAGGFIAATHVKNYNGVALMSTTGAYFIRPFFYPNESHNVDDFKPVYIQCTQQPLLITSSKYKSFAELKSQERITVGAALGTTSDVVARELKASLPNVNVDIIPYNSGSLGALQDSIAGRIDLNIDFPADLLQQIDSGKLFPVGATGSIDHKNMKTFNSQGATGFAGIAANYTMYVKQDTDINVVKEMHEIFSKAAIQAGSKLQDVYNKDFCVGANYTLRETNNLFAQWKVYWAEKLSKLK